MSDQKPTDRSYENRLNPEDQAKVDEFISKGVNSVERKPFKPIRMMLMLVVVVTVLSILSQFLAKWAGIY
jgi:quinol-cytochrome oxidoreductase complex cytochrome b subunit